jgi:hypothetical protein
MHFKKLLTTAALAAALTTSSLAATTATASAAMPDPARPKLGKHHVACSKSFCVHYKVKGRDRVLKQDHNKNRRPDTVDVVLSSAERSWSKFKNEGFRTPLSDRALKNHGPNGKIDIYLTNKAIDPGYTAEAWPLTGGSGFVAIQPRWERGVYSEYGYNKQKPLRMTEIQELRAVTAHELFHLVQFRYEWQGSSMESESQAVWAEHLVYPKLGKIRALGFSWEEGTPHKTPSAASFDQKYGWSTLFRFIERQYGKGSVRKILEAGNLWAWADSQPGGMARLQAEYALANLRAASYYSLGAYLPVVRPTPASFDGSTKTEVLEAFASKTYEWQGSGAEQQFFVEARLPYDPTFGVSSGGREWPIVVTILNSDESMASRQWLSVKPDRGPRQFSVTAEQNQKVLLTLVDPDSLHLSNSYGESYSATVSVTFGWPESTAGSVASSTSAD